MTSKTSSFLRDLKKALIQLTEIIALLTLIGGVIYNIAELMSKDGYEGFPYVTLISAAVLVIAHRLSGVAFLANKRGAEEGSKTKIFSIEAVAAFFITGVAMKLYPVSGAVPAAIAGALLFVFLWVLFSFSIKAMRKVLGKKE